MYRRNRGSQARPYCLWQTFLALTVAVGRQVLARANRERLGALLGEVQRREGGDERYVASLRCAGG